MCRAESWPRPVHSRKPLGAAALTVRSLLRAPIRLPQGADFGRARLLRACAAMRALSSATLTTSLRITFSSADALADARCARSVSSIRLPLLPGLFLCPPHRLFRIGRFALIALLLLLLLLLLTSGPGNVAASMCLLLLVSATCTALSSSFHRDGDLLSRSAICSWADRF